MRLLLSINTTVFILHDGPTVSVFIRLGWAGPLHPLIPGRANISNMLTGLSNKKVEEPCSRDMRNVGVESNVE